MKAHRVVPLCLLVWMILSLPACGSRSPISSPIAPSLFDVPDITLSLSGRVFEISSAGRIPAPGVVVTAVVVTNLACSAPCTMRRHWSYQNTTTGPDGRYTFPQLPPGSVTVLTDASIYRQVCGAGAELGPDTRLDVEITSRANPQPSPTMPGVRITGQIYEMTPAGRVGISGAWLGIDHHGPDSPFLTVQADANGHYTACGIPAGWSILFDIGDTVYEAVKGAGWHQFPGDTTHDIEMRRIP